MMLTKARRRSWERLEKAYEGYLQQARDEQDHRSAVVIKKVLKLIRRVLKTGIEDYG